MGSTPVGEFVVALGQGRSEQGESKAVSPVYRYIGLLVLLLRCSQSPTPIKVMLLLLQALSDNLPAKAGNCRNIASKDDWPTRRGITTLYDQFEDSVKTASSRNCLGWRPIENGKAGPFKWFSYQEAQGNRSAHCLNAVCLHHKVAASLLLELLCQHAVTFAAFAEWAGQYLAESQYILPAIFSNWHLLLQGKAANTGL